ncbi:uncharacterized protein LOC112525782 isoform X2 [Cynara cardunculus var. scolymus]|uniref:uncharacterized protein LOC112525782 isoform X2 n=1 Tax=Cynara cardunculus var. scolymus TaxID=59895 RepID=UPI000D6240A2|nr:uncharacterized protein LOC112525782 isoform X2 [Cynara cardunculus var. scolymus]
MKRSTRVFGGRVLRSGRRLFATRCEEEVKRARLSPVAVLDIQENRGELLDHGGERGLHNLDREDGNVDGSNMAMEIDDEEQERKIKLGEYKKLNGNGTHEEEIKIKLGEFQKVNGEEQQEIKLGKFKNMSLVDDNGSDNVSCSKQFGAVYTRKRKRTLRRDSSIQCSSFEQKCGSDDRYAKKYFKKVRTSFRTDCCDSKFGFDGEDVSLKQSVVSFSHCSYGSGDSISNIQQFPCFMSSNGIRCLQDSSCIIGHGYCKVYGSIFSAPFFTVDINALPFCFLYMHSTLALIYSFLSYAFIMHSVDEKVMNDDDDDDDDDVKLPLIVTTERDCALDKCMIVRKARSARKTVPRVALFKKCFRRNVWAHVENIVPVPCVREIEGYEEDEYVPFMLPETYICSRSAEVTRCLEKSYPIYDMDSDDERWLKELNSERFGDNGPVSEDSLEKIIDAFERGSYCTPFYFSDVVSAIDRCSSLASKETLEAVYSYWMTKRKKKRSSLIQVFQCYPCKKVKRHSTSAVLRKKRSSRRRASQRCVEKQLDFFKEIDMKT